VSIIPEPKDPKEQKPETTRVQLVQIECPTCHGWGRWDDIPCSDCGGDGVKWEMRNVSN
jgi:DnaJ-class molecular chaperone